MAILATRFAGLQLSPQATCPIPSTKNGLWVDSGTANVIKFRKTDGSDTSLGAGGGGGTLATAYTAGASQTDSTLLLTSTGLGVRFRDNSTPISGSLFQIQNSGGTVSYLDVGTTTAIGLKSGFTNGASAVGGFIDTVNTFSTAGSKLWSWRNNGTEKLAVRFDGSLDASANTTQSIYVSGDTSPIITLNSQFGSGVPQLQFGGSASTNYIYGASGTVSINAGSSRVGVTSAAWTSANDLNLTSGTSSTRWTETWSRRFAGVEQTVAAASTVTFDPAAGESIRLTLSATAISAAGIAPGSGYPGEVIRTEFIQDATGSRTLTQANFSSAWVFAGGAYTVTATANKRDIITWMWDATVSKFFEISRAVNL